jgi:uncharacterized Zn-binding protein involved in type VI secretion
MPPAARLGDLAKAMIDGHCCPLCPHPNLPTGPAILGSPNVLINKMPAHRKSDMGMHAPCCGPNMWTAMMGSGTVFINGLAAMRKGDMTKHCGGMGNIKKGSSDVFIGG